LFCPEGQNRWFLKLLNKYVYLKKIEPTPLCTTYFFQGKALWNAILLYTLRHVQRAQIGRDQLISGGSVDAHESKQLKYFDYGVRPVFFQYSSFGISRVRDLDDNESNLRTSSLVSRLISSLSYTLFGVTKGFNTLGWSHFLLVIQR
jgi:hypothetical protein